MLLVLLRRAVPRRSGVVLLRRGLSRRRSVVAHLLRRRRAARRRRVVVLPSQRVPPGHISNVHQTPRESMGLPLRRGRGLAAPALVHRRRRGRSILLRLLLPVALMLALAGVLVPRHDEGEDKRGMYK